MIESVRRWLQRFDSTPQAVSLAYMETLKVTRESVQEVFVHGYFMVYKQEINKETKPSHRGKKVKQPTISHHKSEKTEVIYRRRFQLLLKYPKPLRDQLAIELPILQAFRTGEVSTLRVEHVDFVYGEIAVLDSKKRELFWLPMDTTIAKHAQVYIEKEGLTNGILLQSRKKKRKRWEGLATGYIAYLWEKYCQLCDIPVMSPRMGRAYFACYEHLVLRKPLYYVMIMLRHSDTSVTDRYIRKYADAETIRALFYEGKEQPFISHSPSACSHSASCPFFVAQMEQRT